jgi:hypothetical protein
MGKYEGEEKFKVFDESGLAIGRVNPISRPDPDRNSRYWIEFGPRDLF